MTCHSGKTKHIRPEHLQDHPDEYGPRAFRCDYGGSPGKWTARPCSHCQAERRPQLLAAVQESMGNAREGGYPEVDDLDRTDDVCREMMDYTDICNEFSGVSEDELRPIVREVQESRNISLAAPGA